MSYIGRMIHNIRDFYSEINGATLTGAIDVVVVQQPDGNFTCSPFHVRFGKLGVLRSKEKIVDIEINGESQDIHMKLGESGEAFFVEEVFDSDNEEIPEHLATSPIPVSHFEELYNSGGGRRRNSLDLSDQKKPLALQKCLLENEANDYTKRRYTDSHTSKEKKHRERDFIQRHINLGNIEVREASSENLVKNGETVVSTTTSGATISNATEDLMFNMDEDSQQQAIESVGTIPITESSKSETLVSLPVKMDELNNTSNESAKSTTGKKKRRKKSTMKKKSAQKKALESTSTPNNEWSINDTSSIDLQQQSSLTETEDNNANNKSSSLGGSTNSSHSADLKDLAKDVSEMSLLSQQQQQLGSDNSNNSNSGNSLVNNNASVSVVGKKLPMDPEFHFFSDTELTSTQDDSRSGTPTATDNVQSDTEFEVKKSKDESGTREGKNWAWGELPTQTPPPSNQSAETTKAEEHNSMLSSMFSFMKHTKHRRHSSTDGVYLADISSGAIDPEVAALYFSNSKDKKDADMDCESGNGPSLAQSPNSPEGCKSIDSDFDEQLKAVKMYTNDVSISLCGWNPPPTPDSFHRHLVPFSDLCNNPSRLFESPELVIRIRDHYYNWRVAAPLICSLLVYQRPLPNSTVDQLCGMHMPSGGGGSGTESGGGGGGVLQEKEKEGEKEKESSKYSWWYWRRGSTRAQNSSNPPVSVTSVNPSLEQTVDGGAVGEKTTVVTLEEEGDVMCKVQMDPVEEGYHGSSSGSDHGKDQTDQKDDQNASKSSSAEKCRKTLRLTSEQIKRLKLKDGLNHVEFTVTTAYQGTCRCNCYIYKWKWNDKIVISDIDGTITKSDVLGHILPIVGKDWAQSGVAELFNKIYNNGYKLLYLSARAIGQSRITREYLRSIKQGDLSLPDGPVLLNPTSLLTAFHREVIEKKPERFKISCMSDIRALFPTTMEPFYAGYGNRINDVWAYTAVGIPIVRIFTINPKGELKHELTQTFQSSYMNMLEISDLLFPPLPDAAFEYSQFMHWREPVPLLDDLDLVNI